MIGASLLEEQSVSFLLVIAIFISNIPEGLSSTAGMKNSGYSRTKMMLLWAAVFVISILASWSGYFFLDGASEEVMSAIAAFAGGGIIAMIASTMMPEAYEDSGPMTGLIAALGLLTSGEPVMLPCPVFLLENLRNKPMKKEEEIDRKQE